MKMIHKEYLWMIFIILIFLLGSFYYYLSEKGFSLTETLIYAYFISINILTILMYVHDKEASRNNGTRVPEMILHILEILGGSFFAILTQNFIRHKNKKVNFFIISWIIIIIQATIFYWIFDIRTIFMFIMTLFFFLVLYKIGGTLWKVAVTISATYLIIFIFNNIILELQDKSLNINHKVQIENLEHSKEK